MWKVSSFQEKNRKLSTWKSKNIQLEQTSVSFRVEIQDIQAALQVVNRVAEAIVLTI